MDEAEATTPVRHQSLGGTPKTKGSIRHAELEVADGDISLGAKCPGGRAFRFSDVIQGLPSSQTARQGEQMCQ